MGQCKFCIFTKAFFKVLKIKQNCLLNQFLLSRWSCSNIENTFGISQFNFRNEYSICTYKNMDNQISVLGCNETVISNYICQKSMNIKLALSIIYTLF